MLKLTDVLSKIFVTIGGTILIALPWYASKDAILGFSIFNLLAFSTTCLSLVLLLKYIKHFYSDTYRVKQDSNNESFGNGRAISDIRIVPSNWRIQWRGYPPETPVDTVWLRIYVNFRNGKCWPIGTSVNGMDFMPCDDWKLKWKQRTQHGLEQELSKHFLRWLGAA